MTETKKLIVNLDAKIHARLKALSALTGESINKIVNEILADYTAETRLSASKIDPNVADAVTTYMKHIPPKKPKKR